MNDPLSVSIDLTGVETDLPLLPEGDVQLQVVESIVGPNKDSNGLNWFLKLATTSPMEAIDGRNVNPNFPIFQTIALQAKEDSKDPEAFKRGLGEAIDAIFGTDKNTRPVFNQTLVNEAVGKFATAHIFIDEYQGRRSNKIKRLKKVAVV